jgi:TP901 family phage tail tape measure protein
MGTLGTDYIIRYLSDITDAASGAKKIEAINDNMAKKIQAQYGQITGVIGNLPTQVKTNVRLEGGKEVLETLTTTGQVLTTTSGQFIQLSKTTSQVGNDLKTTSNAVKNVTGEFKSTNIEVAKSGKWFSQLGNNITQLASRALLTIPIWIALRGAIMGFFGGIAGGIKDLLAFDLALQKIRNNLQGTAAEVDSNFKKIRASITAASKETGISTESLARAVKEFATLGFSANESLQGALGASKLSIALFGDAGETAGAFARALNIMIDRSVGAKSAVDQMNEAFALTSQLEETNNFEIKNVTEALDKFAGTAAGAGLTMNQTLAILAAVGTAGRAGAQGATLLSSSFNQLLGSLPDLQKNLGLVTIAGESTFDTFRRILDTIAALNATPGGQNAAIEAMGKIFGGVGRGVKLVQSLLAVKDILDKNIATLPSFDALLSKVDRTMESQSKQAEILGNNLKEMSKSFITALAGSEDFAKAIVLLNNVVKTTSKGLEGFGTVINSLFTSLGTNLPSKIIENDDKKSQIAFQKLIDGLRGQLSSTDLKALIEVVPHQLAFKELNIPEIEGKRVIEQLQNQLQKQLDAGKVELKPKVDVVPVISEADQQTLAKQMLAFKLKELEILGASNEEVQAANAYYTNELGIIENITETSQRLLNYQTAITEENQTLTKLQKEGLVKNYLDILKILGASNAEIAQYRIEKENILNLNQKNEDQLRKQLDLQSALNEENAQLDTIQREGLIRNQLEMLRLQGATDLQIVQQDISLRKLYNIDQDRIGLLQQQLGLNQEITKEKLNQNKVSDDALKLYQVQKEFDIGIAQDIAKFIRGEEDTTRALVKQGTLFERLKPALDKFFPGATEQIQAKSFYETSRGRELASGLPENRAVEEFRPITAPPAFQLPDITTNVGGINIEIKKVFKDEDTSRQILDALIIAIQSDVSIKNAIDTQIDNF